jgi:5'-nucleotidase
MPATRKAKPAQRKSASARPLILISNDDGFDAPGIRALAMSLRRIADIVVVAPATQQSAVGHAITVQMPLRARRFDFGRGYSGWAVEGTPADSVKLAVLSLLDRRPDLVVSGINHGVNTSINVIYSGTVSAATEGAVLGVPSIAVSLATHSHKADMTYAAKVARKIAEMVLKRGLPPGTLLNVNIPNIPADKIAGIALTRQGRSTWNDGFEERLDPAGRSYYWLVGTYVWDTDPFADDVALKRNMVSVTPLHFNLTDEGLFEEMKEWRELGRK